MRGIRLLSKAGIGLLPLLLAGCLWPMSGQGPNRQANNWLEHTLGVGNVDRLERLWQADVDDGPVGDPVTSVAGVHVSDRTNVYGFETTSGARRWAHHVEAPLQATQPFADGDRVLVGQWNPTATRDSDPGASDSTLALDASNGSDEGEVTPGVIVGLRDGRALIADDSWIRLGRIQIPFWVQNLRILDLETGTSECCASLFRLRDPEGTAPAPPADLTFGGEWLFHAGHGRADMSGNPTEPATQGNGLRGYVPRTDGPTCGIFGWGDYCPNWAVRLDGTAATAAVVSDDESVAYVGTDAGTVHAVDVASATVLWSTPVGAAVGQLPALAQGSLFVPTASGELVVLDAETGDRRWSAATGGPASAQPAVAGGVVFTGSAEGSLRAFKAAGCRAGTCEPLWTTEVGSEITGAPAVSHGQLYVGTADGRLLAWGLRAA